jgi:hypothetical protein
LRSRSKTLSTVGTETGNAVHHAIVTVFRPGDLGECGKSRALGCDINIIFDFLMNHTKRQEELKFPFFNMCEISKKDRQGRPFEHLNSKYYRLVDRRRNDQMTP